MLSFGSVVFPLIQTAAKVVCLYYGNSLESSPKEGRLFSREGGFFGGGCSFFAPETQESQAHLLLYIQVEKLQLN